MVEILILAGLIFLNAFFALSEIAVVTLNDKKIKKMSADGHEGAIKVLNLMSNSNDFLAMIQVGVTISGFLTSASASRSFAEPLAESLSFLGFSRGVLEGVATFVVTLVLSYFSLVFGELIPKKIAMQNAEEVSFKVVGVLLLFSKIFKPFIWLLSASANLVLRCFGVNPKMNEQTVTEEEILMMVDAGEEKGLIEGKAKNMIESIFDFDNTTVGEIMTHRTDIVAIESSSSIEDAVKLSIKMGFSRIPVFTESIDKISGILYIKDFLEFVTKPVPKDFRLITAARPAMFVPETKKCDELFTEMTSKKIQIAVVVDEYGGTEGLVTMEDLVESIFGNIQDEYDNEKDDIQKVNETTFAVDGTTLIDDLEKIAGIKIPTGDYDTVAGFLNEKLGRIPAEGERPTIEAGGCKFTVLEVTDRHITNVEVTKL